MAINTTELYTRLGLIAGGGQDLLAIQGAAATARVLATSSMVTRANDLTDEYSVSPANQDLLDSLYANLVSWQGSSASFLTYLQTLFQNTIIQMVNDDTPQLSQTLVLAMTELIRQMTGAATVQRSVPTAGAQTALGTPTGNPIIVASVKDVNGANLQYLFAETLKFGVTSDSQQGATAGSEPFLVTGKEAAQSNLSYLWPGGSAISVPLTAVNGALSNSGGNNTVNGDFTTFTTANYPDNWVALTGTAGGTIFNGGSGQAYTTGGGSLQITGDGGSTLTKIYQQFNTTLSTSAGGGGTPATLLPNTIYGVNLWTKVSAVPAAGVLRIALTDGSNAVVNDDATTANSFTVALTGETTAYANHHGVFITPRVMPSQQRLQIGLTTAIDSGKSVFAGRVGFTPLTPLYTGGPSASVFSGNTNVVDGLSPDQWIIAIGMTWGVFQQFFERFCDMTGLGLTLPNASVPSISDALVT
jgi:hypothetical protein